MLKPNKNCKVCQTIEERPQLEKDIYACTWFIKSSNSTMLDVTRKYEGAFSYHSMQAHVKKHQFLSAQQIKDRNQKALLKQKKAEQELQNIKETTVWDTVIKTGMAKLKTGELEMKTADLLKAAKDKSDYTLKVKDQELQMAEMVAYFASGEGDITESSKYDRRLVENQAVEHYDPTEQPAAITDRRTDESRAFYQSLAGDAPAPGTD